MEPGPFSPQQERTNDTTAAATAAEAGSRPTKRSRDLSSDMAQEEGSSMIKRQKKALGLVVKEQALVSDEDSNGGSRSTPPVDPPQDKAISATGACGDEDSKKDSLWDMLGCLDGIYEEEEGVEAPNVQESGDWGRWNGIKLSSPATMGTAAGAGSASSVPPSSSSSEATVTPADKKMANEIRTAVSQKHRKLMKCPSSIV